MAKRYSVATLVKNSGKQVFAPEETDKIHCWKINSSFYDLYFTIFTDKIEAQEYYKRMKIN